jgi:hypothetical protein
VLRIHLEILLLNITETDITKLYNWNKTGDFLFGSTFLTILLTIMTFGLFGIFKGSRQKEKNKNSHEFCLLYAFGFERR